MNYRKWIVVFLAGTICISLSYTPLFSAPLRVVSSTTDIAYIAREIGKGGLVKISTLAPAKVNLHYLDARPDYIQKTSRADILLLLGAEAESNWLPLVIRQSRNSKVRVGGSGYCDLSRSISLLEKPTGKISRDMGDFHLSGNPHYWLDPLNGIQMARNIVECFSKVDAKNQKRYKKNLKSFEKKIMNLTQSLLTLMKPYAGKTVVDYHSEFIYLTRRFRLKLPFHIEDKPGFPPGPKRIREVTKLIRQNKISLILTTPWNHTSAAAKVAKKSGAKLIILPIQTSSSPESNTYPKMIENCIKTLIKYLQ